jgi:uncharacterized BrkB/YihY/UPF0761 family membrane protein
VSEPDSGGKTPGRVVRTATSAWDRGNAAYDRGKDWVDRQDEASRKGATIGWFRRYRAADGPLYALLIAAYSLLTFLPAMIAIGSYAQKDAADSAVARLKLTGATATLVRDVLSDASSKKLGATLLALANLLLFGLGFGRALQLAHAKAWKIELRSSLVTDQIRYVVALLVTTFFMLVFVFETEELHGQSWWVRLALAPLWILGAGALFTALPYMLLHRRVPVRALWPGALVVALGLTGMRLASELVLVNWLVWYGKYYGGFGVVMALFFWIMIGASIIVIGAALSPQLAVRRDALAARLNA